nr:hypothetical protein [Streptomyces tardus]
MTPAEDARNDGQVADGQAPGGQAPGREAAEVRPAGEQAAPRPLGLVVQPTGHAEVDSGMRRLAAVDHLAVSGHLEVYEDVHRGLRSTLTALDQHDPGS